MGPARRLVALLLAVLLVVPLSSVAQAAPPYTSACVHPDVGVSAGGDVLSTGDQIADDGGFALWQR